MKQKKNLLNSINSFISFTKFLFKLIILIIAKMSRRRYSLEFKSKIILFYRALQLKTGAAKSEQSINYLARLSTIDRRTISPWITTYADRILEAKNKRAGFKLSSQKDVCNCPTMEIQLKDWILNRREAGVCISGATIQKQALTLYNELHPEVVPENFIIKCSLPRSNFKASRGLCK